MKPVLYGYTASFREPEALLEAAKKARLAGYSRLHAYSPFPVEGLAEQVGFRFNLLPWLVLIGGFGGAWLGFFMQWYATSVSYRLMAGGKPLNSWQAYIPITFELGILAASITGFAAVFLLSGLPRPYHPIFNAPGFEQATRDRFFLCIEATDPRFDVRETWQFLSRTGAEKVVEVDD